jgi:calcium-dependent protein kinase
MVSTINPINTQRVIWENLIRFVELNPLQKLVLSLVAGLSASPQELKEMESEFLRLDKNKTGNLKIDDLKKICEMDIGKKYSCFKHTDWAEIFKGVDLNGDGVIDFQDFTSACVDRKTLYKDHEVRKAFSIIDTNKDGVLSLSDFQELFKTYGFNQHKWTEILPCGKNGDNQIDFDEF